MGYYWRKFRGEIRVPGLLLLLVCVAIGLAVFRYSVLDTIPMGIRPLVAITALGGAVLAGLTLVLPCKREYHKYLLQDLLKWAGGCVVIGAGLVLYAMLLPILA